MVHIANDAHDGGDDIDPVEANVPPDGSAVRPVPF